MIPDEVAAEADRIHPGWRDLPDDERRRVLDVAWLVHGLGGQRKAE